MVANDVFEVPVNAAGAVSSMKTAGLYLVTTLDWRPIENLNQMYDPSLIDALSKLYRIYRTFL